MSWTRNIVECWKAFDVCRLRIAQPSRSIGPPNDCDLSPSSMFILIPAALQSSIAALRNPRTLGNILSFRVGVFATSATIAAITYTAQPTVSAMQPLPAPQAAPAEKRAIKRRSSKLEPENKHALVRAAALLRAAPAMRPTPDARAHAHRF